MEIISIAGYTELRKALYCKKSFIAKTVERAWFDRKSQLQFKDDALLDVIRYYTREAGVRSLERNIATICRKAAQINCFR